MKKHVRQVNKSRPAVPPDEAQAQSLIDAGCTTLYEPGWEADYGMGFTALCRPVYRDLQGCSGDCWWPAQVPDDMSSYEGWLDSCSAIDKDWSQIEFVK